MYCPNCHNKDHWVIIGGGNGLLPGWGKWRCNECRYIGIDTIETLNRKMAIKKRKAKEDRIKKMEEARLKSPKNKEYKNTFSKRLRGKG